MNNKAKKKCNQYFLVVRKNNLYKKIIDLFRKIFNRNKVENYIMDTEDKNNRMLRDKLKEEHNRTERQRLDSYHLDKLIYYLEMGFIEREALSQETMNRINQWYLNEFNKIIRN